MTPDQDASATIATDEQDWPADPRPAWERIAYAWLAREVDAGQPVDPATLASEVSVAPVFARDLVRVLRTHRQRDPKMLELRGRLVRDQITDAYLTHELPGGQQLDPAALAAEVGTTSSVARQWLHTLRAGQQGDRRLASLRSEPTSHGRPTPEQLQALQATYAHGGRPQLEDHHPAGWALERIEQLYQARALAQGEPLDPTAVASEPTAMGPEDISATVLQLFLEGSKPPPAGSLYLNRRPVRPCADPDGEGAIKRAGWTGLILDPAASRSSLQTARCEVTHHVSWRRAPLADRTAVGRRERRLGSDAGALAATGRAGEESSPHRELGKHCHAAWAWPA
jgi:hypothetical protein